MSLLLQKYDAATGEEFVGKLNEDELNFAFSSGITLPNVILVSPDYVSDNTKKSTINEALGAATNNELIVVLPGTYSEEILIQEYRILVFMPGVILTTSDNRTLLIIEHECKIYGSAKLEHYGTDVNIPCIRVGGNSEVLLNMSDIMSSECPIIVQDGCQLVFHARYLRTKLIITNTAKLFLECAEIHYFNPQLSSISTVICNKFMQITAGGASKTQVKFFQTIDPPTNIAPIAKNVICMGGYVELLSGTLHLGTSQGYPVEVQDGRVRLRNIYIDQTGTTLNCANVLLGGTLILDNVTMVTSALYSIVGNATAGVIKNYGSKSTCGVAPSFIWGTNYLIEAITINNNVE